MATHDESVLTPSEWAAGEFETDAGCLASVDRNGVLWIEDPVTEDAVLLSTRAGARDDLLRIIALANAGLALATNEPAFSHDQVAALERAAELLTDADAASAALIARLAGSLRRLLPAPR